MIHPKMGPMELNELLDTIRTHQPRSILEIGFQEGGSAYPMWKEQQQYGGKLASIDLDPKPHQSIRWEECIGLKILIGNSQELTTIKAAAQFLKGPFEFAFVDGDHHTEAILKDVDNIMPFMTPKGIVAFHDTFAPSVLKAIALGIQKYKDRIDEHISAAVPMYPDVNAVGGLEGPWSGIYFWYLK